MIFDHSKNNAQEINTRSDNNNCKVGILLLNEAISTLAPFSHTYTVSHYFDF